MTVNYSKQSATASFSNFALLLVRWRGSLWKLILIEAIIWSTLYLGIQATYIYGLQGTKYGVYFQGISEKARKIESSTLLTMLLGFFTSITINRWWAVYELMEWPDGIASLVASHLNQTEGISQDVLLRTRRTCARYIMLSYIFLLRDISEPVKRRFPEYENIGLEMITNEELDAIKEMTERGHKTCKYAVPIHWMTATLKKLYHENEPVKKHHHKSKDKGNSNKGTF